MSLLLIWTFCTLSSKLVDKNLFLDVVNSAEQMDQFLEIASFNLPDVFATELFK